MTWKLLGYDTPPTDRVVLVAEKQMGGIFYYVAQLSIDDEGRMYWTESEACGDVWSGSAQDLWMLIPEVPK